MYLGQHDPIVNIFQVYLNKFNISRHFLKKTSLPYIVKHKSLKMLQLLYKFLMTKLYQTFMITL